MILDFRYSDEDETGWATASTETEAPVELMRPRPVDLRTVDQMALAVAVGAMPLSELRRLLETVTARSTVAAGDPVEACGPEDGGCNSFLDRYLGGGADNTVLDEKDLLAFL